VNLAMDRRRFLQLCAGAGAIGMSRSFAATSPRQPIIDVHLHAYPADAALPDAPNPITGKPLVAKDGEAHLRACLAEMKRLNVVKGVVSGGS